MTVRRHNGLLDAALDRRGGVTAGWTAAATRLRGDVRRR